LAATFSPELADLTVYVIDVAAGDKIPRKGGPGITRSDLLVINKIDLAPAVGASLEVMERDARRMRGDKPFLFTNLKQPHGVAEGRRHGAVLDSMGDQPRHPPGGVGQAAGRAGLAELALGSAARAGAPAAGIGDLLAVVAVLAVVEEVPLGDVEHRAPGGDAG